MHGKTRIQQIRDNMPSLGSLLAIDIVINSDSLSSRNVEFGLYCQVTGSWISPRGRMRAEGQFCCKKKREKNESFASPFFFLVFLKLGKRFRLYFQRSDRNCLRPGQNFLSWTASPIPILHFLWQCFLFFLFFLFDYF